MLLIRLVETQLWCLSQRELSIGARLWALWRTPLLARTWQWVVIGQVLCSRRFFSPLSPVWGGLQRVGFVATYSYFWREASSVPHTGSLSLPSSWLPLQGGAGASQGLWRPWIVRCLALPHHAAHGFRGWKRRRRRYAEALPPVRRLQRALFTTLLQGLEREHVSWAQARYSASPYAMGAGSFVRRAAHTPVFFLDRAYFFPQRLARLPARQEGARWWRRRRHRWVTGRRQAWRLQTLAGRAAMRPIGGAARVRGARHGRSFARLWNHSQARTFYGAPSPLTAVTARTRNRYPRARWLWALRVLRLRTGRYFRGRQLWRRFQWRQTVRTWRRGRGHEWRTLPVTAWGAFYRQPRAGWVWARTGSPASAYRGHRLGAEVGGRLAWGARLAARQLTLSTASLAKRFWRFRLVPQRTVRLHSSRPEGLQWRRTPSQPRSLLQPELGRGPLTTQLGRAWGGVAETTLASTRVRQAQAGWVAAVWRGPRRAQPAGSRWSTVSGSVTPVTPRWGWRGRVWQQRWMQQYFGRHRGLRSQRALQPQRWNPLWLGVPSRMRLVGAPVATRPLARGVHVVYGRLLQGVQRVVREQAKRACNARMIRFSDFVKTFFQPQVRYRPGFAKYWRHHRRAFRLLFACPWGHSQRRLTVYLARLRHLTGYSFLRLLQLSLIQVVWSSGLLPATHYPQVWGAVQGGVALVNGARCRNPLQLLYQADVVSVSAHGRVLQAQVVNLRSRLFWFRWQPWARLAQPPRLPSSLLEIDELVRVVVVLGEFGGGSTAAGLLPARVPFSTLKCYNWKYVV